MMELKPCPFCGGEAKLYSIGTGSPHYGNYHQVVCQGCLTSSGAYWSGEQSAIDAWNTRTGEPIVRCRDCRYYASNMHECMRLDVWDDSLWFSVEQDDFCSFAAKEEQ